MKNLKYIIGGILLVLLTFLYLQKTAIRYDFRILNPNTISVFFVNSGSTTKEFGIQNNCTNTINGSYFGRNTDGSFFPAGLRYSGLTIVQSGNNNEQDQNLQETVTIQQGTKTITFTDNKINLQADSISFNAGPILIQHGIINDQIKQNVSHRNQKHPRTIIIKNDKQEIFFLLIFSDVTLIEATDIIKKQKQLGKNYDAINLDGGPSTSLYSKLLQKDRFNEHEILPIFFCLN